jgi:hypothetical protein
LLNYKQLETLIARRYGASAKTQTGALRARIRHLRRLGLPLGISPPGTGNSITYGKEHIYEILFCLELEQFGIDPRLAVGLLKAYRPYIMRAYREAAAAIQNNEDYFFWLETEFMTARWPGPKRKFAGIPKFQAGLMEDLNEAVRDSTRLSIFSMTPSVKAASEVGR